MQFSRTEVPEPHNEVLQNYAPGSSEAKSILEACSRLIKSSSDLNSLPQVPCVVNGELIYTGNTDKQYYPSLHSTPLCQFHQADQAICKKAISSALAAKSSWENLSFEHRASVFLKAAELISTKYRYDINAATMLGQGKTVWQAEIDAAAETIDFLRFNVYYAQEIYKMQPMRQSRGVWNRVEYRPLEGFVFAVSPFNFSAIGANLCSAPALMGNVVIWKPANTAIYANYLFMKILEEAGLPKGVINFLPGDAKMIGETLMSDKYFAGLHFTGSTATFNMLMARAAVNVEKKMYIGYPRIVGETGGKDFHFIHESADFDNVLYCTLRAAFEYQGQKCSALSRMYVPDTMWEKNGLKKRLIEEVKKIKVGQPDDLDAFMTAVIDKTSFQKITSYIDYARQQQQQQTHGSKPKCEILVGGTYDGSKGYFVQPTIIQVSDPKDKLMQEEVFGPVLTVYVYPADQYVETLKLCNETSPYALTGSIFAKDSYAIETGKVALRNACGNFYINDKCTGAVVGQQPFGGNRASGTNDKAGSALNLLRWTSPQAIKENYTMASGWTYPHMSNKL